jgi:hypothetical protein
LYSAGQVVPAEEIIPVSLTILAVVEGQVDILVLVVQVVTVY